MWKVAAPILLSICLCSLVAAASETDKKSGPLAKEVAAPVAIPLPLPLPVKIVESEEQVFARMMADQHVQVHNKDDLLAQQSMASSAQVQAKATWAATLISLLATIFVLLTLRETRRTTEAAIREAMPYLIPEIPDRNLHPPKTSSTENEQHVPTVRVRFKNIGRTPAELRYAKVRLELVTNDELPDDPPDFEQVAAVQSSAVIAPDHSGGARVWKYNREITTQEMTALAKDHAEGEPLLRFYIIGVVVYDDVFNTRHTHYFCVKIRHGFEAMRGGRRYNRVDRKRAPSYKKETERNEAPGEQCQHGSGPTGGSS